MVLSHVAAPESFASQPRAASEADAGGGAVLVVEDDPFIAQMLAITLRRAGWEVIVADSAADAWARFRAGADRIRLAWVDCGLPDGDGARVGEQMRLLAPGLPLVLASGRDQEGAYRALREEGPTAMLPKPYLPRQVVAQVEALCAAV